MLLLVVGISLAAVEGVQAQCDKSVKITASKTEYLDESGGLMRESDENTEIKYNKTEFNVLITREGQEQKMSGKIRSATCEWKTPFAEGKTVLKVDLSSPSGDSRPVTITIEGKAGAKVTILVEFDERPEMKVRIIADEHKEDK